MVTGIFVTACVEDTLQPGMLDVVAASKQYFKSLSKESPGLSCSMEAQISDALIDIFTECQEKQNHQHLVKAFQKIYSSVSLDEIWPLFRNLVLPLLTIDTHEPSVETSIDFIAKAATHLELESQKDNLKNKNAASENELGEPSHPLLVKLFEFLLGIYRSQEYAVRFRVCQLIYKLLTYLGADAQIDCELYDSILKCMLERLHDICPLVRAYGVYALSRLQTPLDNTCPVIKAYGNIMARDVDYKVRCSVLNCIALSKKILPAIIDQTSDVNEKVCRIAFQLIAEHIPVKALTIEQRVQLLQNGLTDRSGYLKAACPKLLLQSWLCTCAGNVPDLLELLGVQISVTLCEKVVHILFKSSSILDLIQKFDILNDNFADELSKHGDVEELLDLQFILQQLLPMISVMDLSEQASRIETGKMLLNVLIICNVGPSLIPSILHSLRLVYGNTDHMELIMQHISEICEPICTIEGQISEEERRKMLIQLRQKLSFCIEKQDLEKAAQLKHDVCILDAERSSVLEETEKTEDLQVKPCLKQLTSIANASQKKRNMVAAESTNDVFKNPNLTAAAVPKSPGKSKKPSKIPSLKKTNTPNIQSDMCLGVKTLSPKRYSVAAGVMEASSNFGNLCLQTPKTRKRALYNLQRSQHTEASSSLID
ncbi:hypothetical protein Btru_061301 [Bulinus truncatus]|nr:hypothetical protein Btru_061301 [Bulinus truncatus]